jgi:hypothetical protein
VVFTLEPEWQQSASITPQQASTRDGMVRAILEPKTTGVIRGPAWRTSLRRSLLRCQSLALLDRAVQRQVRHWRQ